MGRLKCDGTVKTKLCGTVEGPVFLVVLIPSVHFDHVKNVINVVYITFTLYQLKL